MWVLSECTLCLFLLEVDYKACECFNHKVTHHLGWCPMLMKGEGPGSLAEA